MKKQKKKKEKKLNTQVFYYLTLFITFFLTRAISVFNGHKPCIRITLSILQSFLHFLKDKDINTSTKRKRKERTIFDIKKLRDPCVKEVFWLEVSNQFQVLGTDDVDDIKEMWDQFKEVYSKSAKKVLGEKRRVKSDWLSGKTYKKIEERRGLKAKIGCTWSAHMKERAAAAHAVKDKEVKASARADKRRWLNDLAEEAETAARNNCSGDLYQLTREIAGQGRNMTTIKDKEGKRIVNEDKVLERWREH